VRVFCQSYVLPSGRISDSYCLSAQPDDLPFRDAIIRRIVGTDIEPASIDGTSVPVWFQYTVQFQKIAGVETIELFPHHFYKVEGSGDGYISAQRYSAPETLWCNSRFEYWFAMRVPAEGGKPADVRPLNAETDNACLRRMRAIVEEGQYIPAFLDGAPISAPYSELWTRR
jgi:hypothetical protein